MSEKKKKELSIDEQNKALKIAVKILFVIIVVMFLLVSFNMYELRSLKAIEKGDYITVEDCDRKYSLDNMFDLGLQMTNTEDSVNGSGFIE